MGFVYLIGTPTFGWYKIGKSKTPEVRVQNIGVLLPFKIEVIGVWKSDRHSWLETHLHDKYAANRINGEWFTFMNHEIKGLESYLNMYLSESARVRFLNTFTNLDKDDLSGQLARLRPRALGKWTKEQYETHKAPKRERRLDAEEYW